MITHEKRRKMKILIINYEHKEHFCCFKRSISQIFRAKLWKTLNFLKIFKERLTKIHAERDRNTRPIRAVKKTRLPQPSETENQG